jgi:hypothetical protein
VFQAGDEVTVWLRPFEIAWLEIAEQGWPNTRMFGLIQAKGDVGGVRVNFEGVPNHRQTGNQQRAPWLVFRVPLSHSWSGKDFRFSLTAHLPEDIRLTEEAWLVPSWWE